MKFKPTTVDEEPKGHLTLRVTTEERDMIKTHAKNHGVPVTRFIRLAVFYAIDNLEDCNDIG